jgi:O-acetylserine/cysteine efflux transporter
MQHEARPAVMSLVVWSALIPLSRLWWRQYSGWPAVMLNSLVDIDLTTILSLVYLAFVATIVATGSGDRCWGVMKPGAWRRYLCWCRWLGLPVRRYCWMKR